MKTMSLKVGKEKAQPPPRYDGASLFTSCFGQFEDMSHMDVEEIAHFPTSKFAIKSSADVENAPRFPSILQSFPFSSHF
ncbi:hypothetical protein RRG08_034998 [Elysia crispata]|uniref:Uncharacterized protein n=1 Tax=Elysia crispata TaxID=231223 RepID=A0AAE1DM80_9GAST|nr:hypothetical protein RRG08_034998 [Elysia crispata]